MTETAPAHAKWSAPDDNGVSELHRNGSRARVRKTGRYEWVYAIDRDRGRGIVPLGGGWRTTRHAAKLAAEHMLGIFGSAT